LHGGSGNSRLGCGPSSDLTRRAGDPTADLDTAMFAGNVPGAHQLVGALAPGMAARGRGAIIGVDSMAGPVGLAGGAAHGALLH
jgi:short-subunit dehydrogenase